MAHHWKRDDEQIREWVRRQENGIDEKVPETPKGNLVLMGGAGLAVVAGLWYYLSESKEEKKAGDTISQTLGLDTTEYVEEILLEEYDD